MTLPPELITLASYMAGKFDNQQQALAEPVWYVHLHLMNLLPLQPAIALVALVIRAIITKSLSALK
jgi:hypothetical protein